MKLIISGGTGFVATELIRQGLLLPQISSLVVLSRRPVTAPEGVETAKLRQVILADYGEYPDAARRELSGADACIWTVAITPAKSRGYDGAELRRVCFGCAEAGLGAMMESGPARPFRFMYLSGATVDRDSKDDSGYLGSYKRIRAETESSVLGAARDNPGILEAAVARLGLITSNVTTVRSVWGAALRFVNVVPNITLQQAAAAMLSQVMNGFEGDTLSNEDLRRIGDDALDKTKV